MSWISDLVGVTTKLLTLEKRVESLEKSANEHLQSSNSLKEQVLVLNALIEYKTEEVKELRQDLKVLTEFTQKVAYAVKRNQDRGEDRHQLITQSLKNELLNLESRLNGQATKSFQVIEGGQKRLPEDKDESQG